MRTWRGHNGRVNFLSGAVFNEQILLASAGNDQTVRIWNLHRARSIIIPVRSEALAVTWIDEVLAVGTRAGLLVVEPNIRFLTAD
jgi:WD40 repeat protein